MRQGIKKVSVLIINSLQNKPAKDRIMIIHSKIRCPPTTLGLLRETYKINRRTRMVKQSWIWNYSFITLVDVGGFT